MDQRIYGVQLLLLCVVLALSALGGTASYLQGVREGQIPHSVVAALGEVLTSVVAGLSVLLFGAWKEYPETLTCLCALVAASNGKEVLKLLGQALTLKIKQVLNFK